MSAPPTPSSVTTTVSVPAMCRPVTTIRSRRAVFYRVCQGFRDGEITGGLNRRGKSLCRLKIQLDRNRRLAGELDYGRSEATVGEHPRVDALHQVTQFVDGLFGLLVSIFDRFENLR